MMSALAVSQHQTPIPGDQRAATSILVCGATGNVGRLLVQALQRAQVDTVLAASPKGETVAGAAGRGLDLLSPASVEAAMAGVQRLFLLTPAHPMMEAMTANAVNAAKAAGVQHIVRISGAGADPRSEIAIARLQGRCDQIVIDSGITHTLLRPKNFMQNFATFLRDMVRAGQVYSSQGEGKIPFVDARDIAAAAAQVLTHPQLHADQAYTLTGPEAMTNAQALALIAADTGRAVQLVMVSEEQTVSGMRQAGMPEELVEAMSSLNRIIAAGWVADVSDDLPRLLGYPATRFADFVRDHRDTWL